MKFRNLFPKNILNACKEVCNTAFNFIKNIAVAIKDTLLTISHSIKDALTQIPKFFGFGKHKSQAKPVKDLRSHEKSPVRRTQGQTNTKPEADHNEVATHEKTSGASSALTVYKPNPFLAKSKPQRDLHFNTTIPVNNSPLIPEAFNKVDQETSTPKVEKTTLNNVSDDKLALTLYQPNPFLPTSTTNNPPLTIAIPDSKPPVLQDEEGASISSDEDENEVYLDAPDHFEENSIASDSDDENDIFYDALDTFEDEASPVANTFASSKNLDSINPKKKDMAVLSEQLGLFNQARKLADNQKAQNQKMLVEKEGYYASPIKVH